MRPLFVLHDVLFDDMKSLDKARNIAKNKGDVEILHGSETWQLENLANFINAIFFVSIECGIKLRKLEAKGFLKFFDLKPSLYLSNVYKFCFCDQNSYFKPVSMLNFETEKGKFIKPDSGLKHFTGHIVEDENYLDYIKEHNQPDELCLIAPAVKINREFRFWVINEKIVGSSEYFWDDKRNYGNIPEEVNRFAEFISRFEWTPDDCFTFDVGISDKGDIKLVEYNSFSLSGLYNVDFEKLIGKICEYLMIGILR